MSTPPAQPRRDRSGFTLVELIVIIVVLAILSGVAIPKYIDYTAQAKQSADRASIAGIRVAMCHAFVYHRVTEATTGLVSAVTDIAATLDPPALPDGITINGTQLQDRRGNLYDFVAETTSTPGRVNLAAGSPGP